MPAPYGVSGGTAATETRALQCELRDGHSPVNAAGRARGRRGPRRGSQTTQRDHRVQAQELEDIIRRPAALVAKLTRAVIMGSSPLGCSGCLRPYPIRATKQYMIASLEPAPAWTVVGARDVELRAIRSAREMVGQEARRARRVVVRRAGVAQQPCRLGSGPVERGIIGHPEVPATVSSVVPIERDTIPLRFHASPDTGQGHGIGHEVWLDAIQCSLREFINKLVGLNVLVSRDPQQKHPAARIPRQDSAQR